MKLLLVANTDWYLYNFRRSLAQYLLRQGHEVVMVSPPGVYVERLEELGYRWVCWDVGRQSLAPLGELAALNRLLTIYRQEKPDIVHHFTIKPVLYGSLAARWLKSPMVVNNITGLGYVFLSREFKARMLRPILKLVLRASLGNPQGRVVFENHEDLNYYVLNRMVEADQTSLIRGVGVDVEQFFPLPEPHGVPMIVFPARMLWDKGVAVAIEAARILQGQVKARFVLVGRPDPGNPTSVDEAMLHRWEQEKLIEYWGWKDDMAEVFHQCHIVLLPSLYEGVPTVLLEAAACGKPIVATDIPGCREVVQEGINGLLVPVNQPAALAEALEKLVLDQDLRQRMGQAGRKIVEQQFTHASVNAQTFAVYQSLIKARS